MEKIRFGAFVMTYERPKTLIKTVLSLLGQTFPPEFILVVDNSESGETEKEIKKLNLPEIGYFRTGYNSGPAGAAKIGLQKLSDFNYDWIYWGDDNDPPRDKFVFEFFFKQIKELNKKNLKAGILGGKGGNLNRCTGRIRSLSNSELEKGETIEVDVVPGGHTMLINAELIKNKILPTEKLFFGFEELDFCLKAKKANYKVYVNAADWLKIRHKVGNISRDYRWKDTSFGKADLLWREYYSIRNLLYIFYKNRIYVAMFFLFFKAGIKAIMGFRFGFDYGVKNLLIQTKAISDFITGRYGKFSE